MHCMSHLKIVGENVNWSFFLQICVYFFSTTMELFSAYTTKFCSASPPGHLPFLFLASLKSFGSCGHTDCKRLLL